MFKKLAVGPALIMVLTLWFAGFSPSLPAVSAAQPARPLATVTAYDLIAAMNVLRVSNGLPALIEDPIIDAVAQSTAQTMAATQASWHIGDAPGRIAAAGYGGGAKVWATENFAIGSSSITIDEIMVMWSDESHMLPAVTPAYCNVGAGTATASNGRIYFILQAAYVSGQSCGSYTSPIGSLNPVDGSTVPLVPGIITPVEVAKPNADGNYLHVVQPGQSFWSIAVAYKVTIKQILEWNNLAESYKLQIGDELTIPGPNSKGFATPTPMGMVLINPPDAEGKTWHTVQAYQNLSTISTAYGVTVERLLLLNNLSLDDPLQIGQKLLISPGNQTPTATPRPLTPIERLTPAADGMYYHIVSSGQNATWIASYYGVPLADLLAWNHLTSASVLYPGDKLLLQVTPPATISPTPLPPTETPLPTPTREPTRTPTQTLIPSPTATALIAMAGSGSSGTGLSPLWILPFLALALVAYFVISTERKKRKARTQKQEKSSEIGKEIPSD